MAHRWRNHSRFILRYGIIKYTVIALIALAGCDSMRDDDFPSPSFPINANADFFIVEPGDMAFLSLLANDTIPENADFLAQIPPNGSIEYNGNVNRPSLANVASIQSPGVIYQPKDNFYGIDSFYYFIYSKGRVDSSLVTIQVGENSGLCQSKLSSRRLTVQAGSSIELDLTQSDSLCPFALSKYQLSVTSSKGSVSLSENGLLTYSSYFYEKGFDTLVYFYDHNFPENTASIVIEIREEALPNPCGIEAQDDKVEMFSGQAHYIPIFANDAYTCNALPYSFLAKQGNKGTARIEGKFLVYTPKAEFTSGTDTIVYGSIQNQASIGISKQDYAKVIIYANECSCSITTSPDTGNYSLLSADIKELRVLENDALSPNVELELDLYDFSGTGILLQTTILGAGNTARLLFNPSRPGNHTITYALRKVPKAGFARAEIRERAEVSFSQ